MLSAALSSSDVHLFGDCGISQFEDNLAVSSYSSNDLSSSTLHLLILIIIQGAVFPDEGWFIIGMNMRGRE